MTLKRGLAHYSLIVAYLLFFIAIMVGFIYLNRVQNQVELEGLQRAHTLCEGQNEVKMILGGILDELAAPRDDDEPGDFERREQIRNQVDPLVRPEECPPPPPH